MKMHVRGVNQLPNATTRNYASFMGQLVGVLELERHKAVLLATDLLRSPTDPKKRSDPCRNAPFPFRCTMLMRTALTAAILALCYSTFATATAAPSFTIENDRFVMNGSPISMPVI